jgi:DNA-binding NarL/FixJ family response regulator
MTVRVLVADDEALIRSALSTAIRLEGDMEVVGEAADGNEAVRLAGQLSPDVVVMDVRMPGKDGIDATREISARPGDRPRVLMLTTFDLDEYVFDAMRAGASGFALKRRPLDELLAAIRIVAQGEGLLAPSVTRRLIEHFAARRRPPSASADLDRLTARERQVLVLVARGLSNAEIASQLHMSLRTVKSHVSQVLAKADARDRIQLVILAYDTGLVEPA